MHTKVKRHGYGIITDVQAISGGRVRLKAGTLYAALERLRADKLIEFDREEIVDSRLRRYYRLTAAGGELLAAEAARLQANARVAISRLKPASGVVKIPCKWRSSNPMVAGSSPAGGMGEGGWNARLLRLSA